MSEATLSEIASTLAPDDVFTEEQLIAWARTKPPGDIFRLNELKQSINDAKDDWQL
jgi:hypothetical protein